MKLRPFDEEAYLELMVKAPSKDAFDNFWFTATETVVMRKEMISSHLGEMFFEDADARKIFLISNTVIPASENSIYVIIARRYDDLNHIDVIVPALAEKYFYAPADVIERLKLVCSYKVEVSWRLIPEN